MRLASFHVQDIPPFESLELNFIDRAGAPRPMTVLFGAAGTGKTTILNLMSSTRPGYSIAPQIITRDGERRRKGFAAGEWLLVDDDPERPHPLLVTSPLAEIVGEDAERAALRRREQAFFDRRAQDGRGFVVVAFSGARWFSRVPNLLTAPDRSVLRYDVRAPASFDDATRADLARETKQVLSYAAVACALAPGGLWEPLRTALSEALAIVLRPFEMEWVGARAQTLEPELEGPGGHRFAFDDLPRGAKHLVSIATLVTRALFSAYRDAASAVRTREGVVLVDDADAQLDATTQRALVPLLREAFPRVQWMLATSSPTVPLSCDASEVLALRRADGRIELHDGPLAVIH